MQKCIIVVSYVLKVQRNLTGPGGCEVQPKAVRAAPALSRALARVLNATESKENESEEEHTDADVEESTRDAKPSGKTQPGLWLYEITGRHLQLTDT